MKGLPDAVSAYKRTSLFTKKTVPKGLLAKHNTKKDTWGLIVVVTGSVNYIIFSENDNPDFSIVLTHDNPGVIEPQVYHKVELLSDDTTFYVEFYAEESGDVGLPKFMKESDVSDVKAKVSRAEGVIDGIVKVSIQIVCVGVVAIAVGFLMLQLNDVKQSLSYSVVEDT